jgi:hypothetical protein
MNQEIAGSSVIKEYLQEHGYSEHVVTHGLGGLLATWVGAVAEIKSGYLSTEYEYLNEMNSRRAIHEVWSLASEHQKQKYSRTLEEADKRFFEYTIPSPKCIWGEENATRNGYVPDIHWWYYRMPIKKDETAW